MAPPSETGGSRLLLAEVQGPVPGVGRGVVGIELHGSVHIGPGCRVVLEKAVCLGALVVGLKPLELNLNGLGKSGNRSRIVPQSKGFLPQF